MFFERFKTLCDSKQITPTKASQEIGFSKGTVSNWYKNYKQGIDTPPRMNIAKKIAEYFDVSLDYLLNGDAAYPLRQLVEERRANHNFVFRDGGLPASLLPKPTLTDHEVLLIDAYRQHPELQALINQALGIPDETEEHFEKA